MALIHEARYFSQIQNEFHACSKFLRIPYCKRDPLTHRITNRTIQFMTDSQAPHNPSEDAFEDFAELYELTHRGKNDDLGLYLEAVQQIDSEGDPILEIGCGTGRVTFELAKMGRPVVGVDLSANMLRIAKRKLDELPEEIQTRIELHEQDMVKLDLKGQKFPLILMPFAELAHVPTRKQHEETLARIFSHLQPGGRLILSMSNWDAKETRIHYDATRKTGFGPSMPLTFEGIFDDEENDRWIHRYIARGYDPSQQMALHAYVHEVTDRDGKMIAKKTHLIPIRYIFRYEMELLLENAGFEIEDLFGYYDKSPFQYNSKRMIFVATKPRS